MVLPLSSWKLGNLLPNLKLLCFCRVADQNQTAGLLWHPVAACRGGRYGGIG